MEYYLEVLKEYTEFNGRVRRKKFWMFNLVNFIIALLIAIFLPPLSMLYSLLILIPSLAVTVRRLHDTGRSGWWWLLSFIPFLGGIILLIFLIQDSETGVNKYGPNPKKEFYQSSYQQEIEQEEDSNQISLESGADYQIECNECGKLIDPGVKFCPNCGNEIIFTEE